MTIVRMNLTSMFTHREPWDCSNSVANLGDQAGRLTWQCALAISSAYKAWLLSPLPDALEYIHTWACEAGAWERAEIDKWTAREGLALLVQNVASDLRMLGSDDNSLELCADKCQNTDWEKESEYPTLYVFVEDGQVMGEVYS